MNGMTETTTWIRVEDQLPDADETVLIHVPEHDEPVWLGYYDDGQWHGVDAMPLGPGMPVTHWAPMLKGPEASNAEG